MNQLRPVSFGAPFFRRCLSLVALFSAVFSAVSAAEAGSGTVTGTVSNAATRNLLEGARVEIPALRLSTLVDETGRYVIGGLPAGTHELVVSYIGLDTSRTQVTVAGGQRVVFEARPAQSKV